MVITMKKALSLFISAILVLSLSIGAVSASAALSDRIDLSSLVSSLSDVSLTTTTNVNGSVTALAVPSSGGIIDETVTGNTKTLTAKANDEYKFVAWFTSILDVNDDSKAYSTEPTIKVTVEAGVSKTFYAVFESTETTSSISVSIPTSVTIPTRPSTEPTSSSQTTTKASTSSVTADAGRVERASQLMDSLNKSLSKANEPETTKADKLITSTTKAASSKSNKPKKTSVSKLTPQKKGFKVTWKKSSNAKGYQVKYSTSKKFPKKSSETVTVKKATTTSKTVKNLKKNKTYYVKVRSYKTVNGKKVYSDWSNVKSVKTK